MVKQGHAWAYREYLEDKQYCAYEAAARAAGRGLWAPTQAPPCAPWEWRRKACITNYTRETLDNCLSASGRRPSTPAPRKAPRMPPEPSERSDGCLIKGNINKNGDRIYHVPDGPSYDSTIIDESKGEQWFCNEQQAVAAGWRAPR